MAAKGSLSKTLVWIILGLLIVGLAGFGATNFSGSIRSVGSVGDVDIDVNRYARSLQTEIRAIETQTGQPLPFQQALALGLDQQVMGQLILSASIDNEAQEIGLSVGDDELAKQISVIPQFQGPDGRFDREAYSFALRNSGMTESAFEDGLRAESARTLLQAAILSGNAMPAGYLDVLLAYAGEGRSFHWVSFTSSSLTTGVPVPNDDALRSFYNDNIADYTLPQRRQITFAWLTPDMLIDTVELDDATLRASYDERNAEFNQPERRLVERLVFGSDAEVEAALARIEDGSVTFEDLVAERGLDLGDVDMGDVTIDDLGDAGEAVFAAERGTLVGPQPSEFGAALFRVNAVLAAQSTSFEDAIPALRQDLALDRARRVIDAQIQSIDDLLAGGATLEDLASETDMQLGKIDWHEGMTTEIASYNAFRQVAASVTADDFPEVADLGDGGIFALRLDGTLEAAPQPFDEVAQLVRADLEVAETARILTEQAKAYAAELGEGRTFDGLGLTATSEVGIKRNGFVADLPFDALTTVFEMTEGEARAIQTRDGAILVQLSEIIPVDRDDEDMQRLGTALSDQASSGISQDLFRALSTDIRSRVGIELDQNAINAVHTQFQ
ncbi:MAG: SurA N-terminal domain-containing protein [Rhodobacteraceae bacterium]|nr:SurA N-terminal domain-containing protein [Paracoccaceae bacterium]